jgi:hypothetical protein
VLFFLVFFAPTLLQGKFLVAGDAFYQSYPLRTVAWGMIRRGELPLWTPYVFSGYPLLSMAQVAIGYPLTWGYLFLPGHWAEEIVVLAPFLLAPAFTYFYAREIGRSRAASLIAALAFTYGGSLCSKMGGLGLMANGEMWLPLFLIAIERARRGSFTHCLTGATAAYTMSVLAGQAQAFFLVGMVALAYAAFVSIFQPDDEATRDVNEATQRSDDAHGSDDARSDDDVRGSDDERHGDDAVSGIDTRDDINGARDGVRAWLSWARWRPLAVACGAILLSVGVAAFQVLESARAARRSVRSRLLYETFVEGSFTPAQTLRAFLAPVYHYIEVTPYVAPLAALLALLSIIRAARAPHRSARLLFWIGVAIVSWLLMLGDSTPLYRLLYHVPVFNLFRYPSRHAYEWTFALGILAAYGWDALATLAARAHTRDATKDHMSARGDEATQDRLSAHAKRRARARDLVVAFLLCAVCAAIALLWWRDAVVRPLASNFGLDSGLIPALAESRYMIWKLVFTCAVVLTVWRALKMRPPSRARTALLAFAVAISFYVEPQILQAHVWFPYARTVAAFTDAPPVSRWLAEYAPEENRVYTRVNLFVVGYWTPPPVDLPNMTAARGLHNVAGYDQLILERYSRALGDAGPDAVNPRYGVAGKPDATLFAPRSRVLDLLNTSFVVTFANLSTNPVEQTDAAARAEALAKLDATRWQLVYESGGVWVLRNLRACPRAWLVGEALPVDGEEALRRIRGERDEHANNAPFDPRRTALVEDAPSELPHLAGGELAADSAARVVEYAPNHLIIETNADRDSLLVVSEIFYPGWEASIDGRAERIRLTDFLLRGVFVPAGRHRVEMHYAAPAVRNGAIISATTIALLFVIGTGGRIRRAARSRVKKK